MSRGIITGILAASLLATFLIGYFPEKQVDTATASSSSVASVSAPVTVSFNETFVVTINVSQVTNLNAFQFDLSYDKTVILVPGDDNDPSVVTGGLIGTTPVPISGWAYQPPGSQGKLRVLGRFNNPNTTVSSTGYLAQVYFKAVGAPGKTSSLTLSGVSWFNKFSVETNCSIVNGWVSVIYGSEAVLVLTPAAQSVYQGSTFNLAIQVFSNNQSLDTVEVDLDFNPADLEVQSITPDSTLPNILKTTFDNSLGQIDFAASKNTGAITGNFTLADIIFKARLKGPTFSSPITFHQAVPRKTGVSNAGSLLPSIVFDSSVQLIADAPLALEPSQTSSLYPNQTFDISIKTKLSQNQSVDGVQANLNFDPGFLEVVDANTAQSGIQISAGSSLNTTLSNSVNNNAGTIFFSAGQFTPPFPTGNFTVATAKFRAKPVSNNITSPITFILDASNNSSFVDFGGSPIPGTHADATVQIIPGGTASFSLALQGGFRPDSGWVVPLTVKFFTPGTNTPTEVATATPVYQLSLTTSKSGNLAIAQANGIIPGTFDVVVVAPTCLANVKREITFGLSANTFNFGTLLAGNANDNNIINIQDFGILAASYGKSPGQAGFDARADFDKNGTINIADFGLLASNYGKSGPVEIP